jgi:hypothetical protein
VVVTAQTRILQIKIALRDARPAVWRRLLVPESMTLLQLHEVAREAMDWPEDQPYEFEVDAQRFGPLPDEDDDELLDDATATLGLVAGEGSDVLYVNDGWFHTVAVERVLTAEPGARYPRCVAGARPCPPVEVGGPQSFAPAEVDKRLEPLAWVNGA